MTQIQRFIFGSFLSFFPLSQSLIRHSVSSELLPCWSPSLSSSAQLLLHPGSLCLTCGRNRESQISLHALKINISKYTFPPASPLTLHFQARRVKSTFPIHSQGLVDFTLPSTSSHRPPCLHSTKYGKRHVSN